MPALISALKNEHTKRILRATRIRPPAGPRGKTPHYRLPVLEAASGYLVLGKYRGPEIVKAAELAACDLGPATEVGHVAGRDQHKKNGNPGQLGRWHVLEDGQPFQIRNPKRKSDPPIPLRRVFVHSSARASAAATSRAKAHFRFRPGTR